MNTLPDVKHQVVHITVNPKKRLLKGWVFDMADASRMGSIMSTWGLQLCASWMACA